MADKQGNAQKDVAAEIESAVSRLEMWLEKYQKQIWIGLGVVVAIAALVFFVNRYYLEPRSVEAQDQMQLGQELFAADNFQAALDGDSVDFMGFAAIADEYSGTPSGNLANYYAAICCFKLGRYDEAIEFAADFDAEGSVNPSVVINGVIGDSYCELGDLDNALKFYEKASESENIALSSIYLRKAGNVLETQGKADDAIQLYQTIKTKYPQSPESQDADKWIERASLRK